MLRTAFKSSIAVTSRSSVLITRPRVVLGTRFNSSRTPEQQKAWIKAKEELQKDWIAPILSYEEVKQKSQQPSEVRTTFAVCLVGSHLYPECIFDRCAGTRRSTTRHDPVGG
jgi:hypothetical protein